MWMACYKFARQMPAYHFPTFLRDVDPEDVINEPRKGVFDMLFLAEMKMSKRCQYPHLLETSSF